MNITKTLSVIFTCVIFLTGKSAMAEGLADRMNEGKIESISAELLIQHINATHGATAAGKHMTNTAMPRKMKTLEFHYRGLRHQDQFKNMTASEYRKEVFGSN